MQSLPPELGGLAQYRQFMLYKKVPSRRPGKTDKFPVSLAGDVVDAHDPAFWTDAATACSTAAVWGEPYGVAFVFTSDDPFWFLDVDNCLDESGQWSALAQDLCRRFAGAAVEVSGSGQGLHLFGTGTLPEGPRRKKNIQLGIEFYTELRFVALTGTSIVGNVSSDHSEALAWLISNHLTQDAALHDVPDEGPRDDWSGPEDDDELLAKIRARRPSARSAFGGNAATPAQLLDADVDALAAAFPDSGGVGSPYDASSADMALAQHLAFWTGCDTGRIERIMRASALARDKWDVRPGYLEHTIALACERQSTVYQATRPAEPLPPPVTSEQVQEAAANWGQALPKAVDFDTFLPADRQVELFRNCVYIQDRHQISSPFGLLSQGPFRALYGGHSFALSLDNAKVTRNAWEAFTESQAVRFPKATSTCFRPELPFGAIIYEGPHSRANVYQEINTRREVGDVSPLLYLLERQIPDERDRRILLTYAASMIQNKGKKFQWWPVIQGAEGNGKSFLASAIKHAIGHGYSFAPNVAEIAKAGMKFNAWMDGRLFVSMEEVYVPERRSFLEDFKTTVTNDWLPIERKGIDAVMGDNRANGMMFTNHQNGVPVTIDGRRYCIFFCAQQSAADIIRDGLGGSFFQRLYDWAKGEGEWAHLGANYGYAVIHEFLATYPLDPEFDPAGAAQRAPKTTSSALAVEVSRGTAEQQLLEVIAQDRQGFRGGWVSSIALDKLLDELRLASRFPQTKRRELMQSLGYDWHPALLNGRVNNSVLPDMAKPRLYVLRDGPLWDASLTPGEVSKQYSSAQLTEPS